MSGCVEPVPGRVDIDRQRVVRKHSGRSMMDQEERYIKEVVVASIGKCVGCGRPYDTDNITVLGHQDDLWFLMIVCRGCSSHGLVAAVLRDNKPTVLTELTEEECIRFQQAPKVSADDVLEVHEFLREFDGDFATLFGLPRDRAT